MKKNISTDRYDEFHCIGGECTYNCCCSDWKKDVSDKEYETFRQLQDPYRDTILENIEGDAGKRCFHMVDGHCGLLTAEGWCSIVQRFGDEILPRVCQVFPRSIARYGNITEYGVEIACPPVAERLFEDKAIEIREQQADGENDEAVLPTETYTALAAARAYLFELFRREPASHTYGKLYLMYTLMYRLRELIAKGQFTGGATEELIRTMQSEELINGAFAQADGIRSNMTRRIAAIRNAQVIQETIGFAGSNEKIFKDDRAWTYIRELCADDERLGQELEPFLSDLDGSWPAFTENFFVHSVFQDWINLDLSGFGDRMIVRAFEYTLIIMLGMAEKKTAGELPAGRYALIISWAERMIIHNRAVPDVVLHAIEHAGIHDASGIMTILV